MEWVFKCPKCNKRLGGEDNLNRRDFGKKFIRCPKCKNVCRSGKILFSDLTQEDQEKYKTKKKRTIKTIAIVMVILFVLFLLTGENGILFFAASIYLFIWLIIKISSFRNALSWTLDKISKDDRELYELEVNLSKQIKHSLKDKNKLD